MGLSSSAGGRGLNIIIPGSTGSGSNGEWALDYNGLKLITIPKITTVSKISPGQLTTITVSAEPVFSNIKIVSFKVKFPNGEIVEYPAVNNKATFSKVIDGTVGSQQTIYFYAVDNSGNRSATVSQVYTVGSGTPPVITLLTNTIPNFVNSGDVKSITISGGSSISGLPVSYSLILPSTITASKVTNIQDNEVVVLTVGQVINSTMNDNITIRVIDPSGGEVDSIVPIVINSGGISNVSGGLFNIRTNIPPNAAQGEVFISKIWELGTPVGYTYDLILPSGITADKVLNINNNDNITFTINGANSNIVLKIEIGVKLNGVSVGSFVAGIYTTKLGGETLYVTPGTYEFVVPAGVSSISVLEVLSDKAGITLPTTTNLSSTDLSGADLSSANLTSANLSSANLYGANLHGATINGVQVTAAQLTALGALNANKAVY